MNIFIPSITHILRAAENLNSLNSFALHTTKRNSNYYNIYKLWSDVFERVDVDLYKKDMNIIPNFIDKYKVDFKIAPNINIIRNVTRINDIKELNEILIEKSANLNSLAYLNHKNFMSPDVKDLILSLFYPSVKLLGKECFGDEDILIR